MAPNGGWVFIQSCLTSETVEGPVLSFDDGDYICDNLSLCMLSVGDIILKESFQDTTDLFIDESRDMFHTTSVGKRQQIAVLVIHWILSQSSLQWCLVSTFLKLFPMDRHVEQLRFYFFKYYLNHMVQTMVKEFRMFSDCQVYCWNPWGYW